MPSHARGAGGQPARALSGLSRFRRLAIADRASGRHHAGRVFLGILARIPANRVLQAGPAQRDAWKKLGMPTDVDAPRGGRAEIIRSTDGGKTWSRPSVLIDTPWDDRAPNFCQLKDGTILCSFFTYPGPSATDLARNPAQTTLTGIIRSFDNGRTWEQEPKRLPVPFIYDATDGPIIELKDGSALLCVYGRTVEARHDMVAFCRSTDRGESWKLLATVAADHEMSETAVAQLADGRLVLISRPEGDIAWSSDLGRTWTKPVPLGIRLFEPRLITLRDGTLLCLHGSYGAGGLRAMFSNDGGRTWLCPNARWGYPVDSSVYGYGQAVGAGRRLGVGCLHPYRRPFDERRELRGAVVDPPPRASRPRRHRPAARAGERSLNTQTRLPRNGREASSRFVAPW